MRRFLPALAGFVVLAVFSLPALAVPSPYAVAARPPKKTTTTGATTTTVVATTTTLPATTTTGEPTTTTLPPSCSGVPIAVGQDIQATLQANSGPRTYCLAAGIHRMTVQVNAFETGDKVFGAGRDATILNGARILTGWSGAGPWVKTGQLPNAYSGVGECENTTLNLCRHYEELFLDGVRQVEVPTSQTPGSGQYSLNYQTNTITFGTDPTSGRVELSVVRGAFNANASVEFGYFTAEMFATSGQDGTVQLNGPSSSLHDVTVARNHGLGFKVNPSGDGSAVTDVRSTDNSQMGAGTYQAGGTTWTRVELDGNNRQARFWVNDWESGGFKIDRSGTMTAPVVVQDSWIHGNLGIGMWADDDAAFVRFLNNQVEGNAADGVRYEISSDGTVAGNTVVGNGCGLAGRRGVGSDSAVYVAGLKVNTAERVEVSGNTLAGNANGIVGDGRNRSSPAGTPHNLTGLNVHDNTVTLNECVDGWGQGDQGLVSPDGQTPWNDSTNRFQANQYSIPVAVGACVSGPAFAWAGSTSHTWPTWQSSDGQDQTGSCAGSS